MPLKIGLIGCGKWGRNILRDLLKLKCKVYVCDVNHDARKYALSQNVIEVYKEANQLPHCDGFVVAVPIPNLTPVCAELISRKKPVFAEKTLLTSMDDVKLLLDLGGDRYIFPMHKWVYHPGIEALKIIAQSGHIGQLKEICCIRHGWVDDFYGGDVFWTLAIHDLTIVKHIFGYIPAEISTSNIICTSDGLPVALSAILGRRPVANLSINSRHTEKISRVSIHGNKGTAILQNATDDHILVRNQDGIHKIEIDTSYPLYLELEEFINYLIGGKQPRNNFYDAVEITKKLLELRNKSRVL